MLFKHFLHSIVKVQRVEQESSSSRQNTTHMMVSTGETNGITVHVKYKDVEKIFSGNPEQVWASINQFFGDFLPSFEVARKLVLKVDLQQLVKDSEGIIAFSKEGSSIMVPRDKLTDNETLALWLLASYIGSQLGMLQSGTVSREELQVKLGKSSKIASTRLGELVKNGLATKIDDEKYSITTFGIIQAQKGILPRIKAKTGA
jgi:hypothetical protein